MGVDIPSDIPVPSASSGSIAWPPASSPITLTPFSMSSVVEVAQNSLSPDDPTAPVPNTLTELLQPMDLSHISEVTNFEECDWDFPDKVFEDLWSDVSPTLHDEPH
eukprot:c6102_g1_i1.p1 GENE.c6102_g1_i1~~c6102_g1_i1.p1  ORF type:complete len:106 (+),score=23.90 c6102_g1_i1:796-1113(+)